MEESELMDYAEESLKEGYTKEELLDVLVDEGFDRSQAEGLLTQIDDDKFAEEIQEDIKRIDLEASDYKVHGDFLGGGLEIRDSEDKEIIESDDVSSDEAFSFRKPDGEEILRVEPLDEDEEEDYQVVDAESGEPFLVLETDLEPMKRSWLIRKPDQGLIARLKGQRALSSLRKMFEPSSVIPIRYRLENENREEIGELKGSKGRKDSYSIDLNAEENVEVLKAALIVINSLESC